jgi:hypothetical protein
LPQEIPHPDKSGFGMTYYGRIKVVVEASREDKFYLISNNPVAARLFFPYLKKKLVIPSGARNHMELTVMKLSEVVVIYLHFIILKTISA